MLSEGLNLEYRTTIQILCFLRFFIDKSGLILIGLHFYVILAFSFNLLTVFVLCIWCLNYYVLWRFFFFLSFILLVPWKAPLSSGQKIFLLWFSWKCFLYFWCGLLLFFVLFVNCVFCGISDFLYVLCLNIFILNIFFGCCFRFFLSFFSASDSAFCVLFCVGEAFLWGFCLFQILITSFISVWLVFIDFCFYFRVLNYIHYFIPLFVFCVFQDFIKGMILTTFKVLVHVHNCFVVAVVLSLPSFFFFSSFSSFLFPFLSSKTRVSLYSPSCHRARFVDQVVL